jgi:hypothetical protein
MSRISPLQSSSWWMMAPKRLGVALQSLQIAALVPRSIFRLWAISRISPDVVSQRTARHRAEAGSNPGRAERPDTIGTTDRKPDPRLIRPRASVLGDADVASTESGPCP